jgi:hypothetical protein
MLKIITQITFLGGAASEATTTRLQQLLTGVGLNIGVTLATVLGAETFLLLGLFA